MLYMLLIYEDGSVYGDDENSPALREIVNKHRQFGRSLGDRHKGGAGLKGIATATTVRTVGGSKTIHDGPFAETKEQLGGFYIVDVPDLDAAIAIAREIPLLANGSVEIRPVLGVDDPGAA